MSDYNVGEIAKVKVGRNLVDVEILECTEGYFKVKSIASGRIFESAKLFIPVATMVEIIAKKINPIKF